MLAAQKQIARFNRKHPKIALDSKSIRQSIRSRLRYSNESMNGVSVNKNLRHLEKRMGL